MRPTGKFRVYLGAAAGVGKTCAMLDEGWRRFQRGADVVVGFVETHKRPYTVEQIRDLPVVPRKQVEYRDSAWEEMDVDAVLARKPEVALIDELAHTNVPGSGRHEKRWEDVLEILDAGIAVITTVNVQHIESLADAVERITGVGVRERVPDWVVRRADQLELIDSSADQLRRRMLHGNIYPENKVPGGAERVLPGREPGRAPRAVAALRGRRDRGGAARVPAVQGRRRRAVGDDRADHGGRDRRAGERLGDQAGGPHRGSRQGPLVAMHVALGRRRCHLGQHGGARGVGEGGRRQVADGGG